MASYRQYCPIARATEILAERWSLLIVRNLMFGATTFSGIAQGVPTMSRSMLTKRLRELEQAGVITSTPKPNGQGSTYALTDAGADLVGVVDSLGRWAEAWVEVLPEHTDPGFALWAWCQVQLNRDALPAGRVVVHFEFPDERVATDFSGSSFKRAAPRYALPTPGVNPSFGWSPGRLRLSTGTVGSCRGPVPSAPARSPSPATAHSCEPSRPGTRARRSWLEQHPVVGVGTRYLRIRAGWSGGAVCRAGRAGCVSGAISIWVVVLPNGTSTRSPLEEPWWVGE